MSKKKLQDSAYW